MRFATTSNDEYMFLAQKSSERMCRYSLSCQLVRHDIVYPRNT